MIMVEEQYIAPGLPHSDGLSGASNLHDPVSTTAAGLPASPYPDLTPYASVSSSFNSLPGQCDSSLLTPISVAGSPPLHQVSKIGHQYPPPPTTPNTQQPTPPGSSKMYHQQWTGQFDVNGQSPQTSSPMAPQPPVAQEFLDANYVHDGRRTPGPPEPYMGAFGVSNGPEPQAMNQPYYLPVAPPVDHHNPMMIRDHQHMQMGIHHREMPPAPLLNEPHPSQFRQQRRSSVDDSSIHGMPMEVPRSVTGSPRRRGIQAPGRVKKRQTKSRQPRNIVAEDPLDEHKNCFGQEVPPSLKSTCPDEERCIFDSRWQHRHQKGQDMWESIQNDFKDRFNKCPGKEMLQMKFKRGRSKYIDWLPKDEELLREAWARVEKSRYQMILETFIELGGSRNMRLSASDVEVKVVNDLKLEEGLYMESHGDAQIRRRRKSMPTRKRSGARGVDDAEIAANDEMMSVDSHNTHEDDVINQVHGPPNFKLEDDASAGPNSMMDMQLWDQQIKIEPGMVQQRSDRMQPMMRMSPTEQTMYGGRRGS